MLTGEDGYGLRVTETLRFHVDSYLVDHHIKVENRHAVAQSAEMRRRVRWPAVIIR